MFGKSTWFREDSGLSLPLPSTRQGWQYYGMWLAAIVAPAALLVVRGQLFPECLIWIAVSGGAFLLDARRIAAELRRRSALARMHFIRDDAAPSGEAAS